MIDEGHIVGNHTVNHPSMPDLTNDKLKEEIIKANNNLTESNKSNDWSLIGQDIEKLQSLINQLEKLNEEAKKEQASKIEQVTE